MPQKELHFWHGLAGLSLGVLVMILLITIWQLLQTMVIGELPMSATMTVQAGLVLGAFLFGAIWPLRRRGNHLSDVFFIRNTHPLFYVLAAVGVLFAGALCDEVASLLHRWRPEFFSLGAMGEISDTISNASAGWFVVVTVALSVLPAIGEELMFRGLVLRTFRRDMPAHFAVIYSAILFGLIHFSWLQGTAAGLLGCYLGAITLMSGSLVPAVIAHFVNNLSWCLLSRYQSGFMDDVLNKGHSWLLLGGCLLVVSSTLAVMFKLRRPHF